MRRSPEGSSVKCTSKPLYASRRVCNAVFLTMNFSRSVSISFPNVQPFSKTTLTRNGLGVHDDVTHTTTSQKATHLAIAQLRRVNGIGLGEAEKL